jgi:DNA-binding transcriptional ArsR family regulator
MSLINEISVAIVKNAKDGESIHSLAAKIGFAYSAVYGWVSELEKYGVISLIRKGNINIIKINKNLIYRKFKELDNAVSVIEKDNAFWELVKILKLKIRFVRGTAAAIWTRGSFITGDFYDRIYFLEVAKKDASSLKKALKKQGIAYTEGEMNNQRPLAWIIQKKDFRAEKKQGLPIMPLGELVSWSKELHLENILEQLNMLYNLGLNVKYAEVLTND